MNASCNPDRGLLAVLFLAATAAAQAPWQPRLRQHLVIPPGVSSGFFATAEFVDFDGDGDLDVAATWPQGLVLLANDGSGRFAPWTPTATVPTFDSTMGVGDLDGDGDVDVATYDGYVENRGAGGPVWHPFQFGSTYLCADLNGDGRSDVVTELGIWESLGGGAFALWPGTQVPYSTTAVVAADLDADGDLDLVFGCSGSDEVWRNDGAGSFVDVRAAWLPGDVARSTDGLIVADLDGDGFPDLGRNQLSVWQLRRNSGTGVLQPWVSLPDREDGKRPIDLDGDGDVDLVGAVSWWRNDGAGLFTELSIDRDLGRAIAVGDVNGDGRLDLLVGSLWRLLLQTSGGAWVDATRGAGASYFACAGDLDGDGAPDLLDRDGVVHRNDGGDWTDLVSSTPNPFAASNTTPWSGQCVDVDGDGDLDVVGVGFRPAGVAFVLRNHGNGTFAPAVLFGTNVSAARSLDADGDGDADVLLSGMQLLRNDGTGALVADPVVPVGGASIRAFGIGDFDGDGDIDVLGGDTRLQMFVNDGTGQFTWTPTRLGVIPGQNSIGGILVADYDGDGDLDAFVWQDRYPGPFGFLLDNLGNGTLVATAGRIPPLLQRPEGCASGDIDGDGDIDLLVGGPLWVNDGTGTFADAGGGRLDFPPILVDLDGDGDLDVAGQGLQFEHRWHAEAPFLAMAGTDYRLEFGGTAVAGGLAVPFVGLPARVPLPPYGTIGIDLTTAIPLSFAPIDAAGVGQVSVPIPALPALVGIRFCAQAVLIAGGEYHLSPAICDTVF